MWPGITCFTICPLSVVPSSDTIGRRWPEAVHKWAAQSFAFQTQRFFPGEKPQSFQKRETLRYPSDVRDQNDESSWV